MYKKTHSYAREHTHITHMNHFFPHGGAKSKETERTKNSRNQLAKQQQHTQQSRCENKRKSTLEC